MVYRLQHLKVFTKFGTIGRWNDDIGRYEHASSMQIKPNKSILCEKTYFLLALSNDGRWTIQCTVTGG